MADLLASLRAQKRSTQSKVTQIAGMLGIKLNGAEVMSVSGRPGYVYVRLFSNNSEIIQAYNGVVALVYDLPVLVVWEENHYKIVGRDVLRYQDWGDTPYLPIHGNQHTFDRTGQGGGDLVWVKGEQFYPFGVIPSGTVGSGNLVILPSAYLSGGEWKCGGNTGTVDLTVANPTEAGYVRMLLVCINKQTSNPAYFTGTSVEDTLTEYELVRYYPVVDTSAYFPLAAIKLVSGTSSLGWSNIYDARQYYI